jgi:hypothetical protein
MYLGILAIFKNEEMVIEEWVEHYLWQGVEHFYMIDNGSTDGSKDKLSPYIQKGLVTYYYLPKSHSQREHYNLVYTDVKQDCEWLIICDLDEYIYSSSTIINQIKLYEKEYEFSSIILHWRIFGSSGLQNQPMSIRKSFLYRATDKENYDNASFNGYKSIIRTSDTNKLDIHLHHTDPNKNRLIEPPEIKLNHYVIMSLEYFQKVKMTRGDAGNIVYDKVRDMNYFYKYDKNDQLDDELASLL